MGKLINRMPGSRLLISSLQGSTLRTASLAMSRGFKALPCQLDIYQKTLTLFSLFIRMDG